MQLKISHESTETRYSKNQPLLESRSVYAGLIDGSTRELSNLRLGRNFVTAVLEDGISKAFISNQSLLWLRPREQIEFQPHCFPRTSKSASELIALEALPVVGKFWYLQDPLTFHTRTIFSSSRGLVVTEPSGQSLILIAALGYLELSL